MQPQVSEKGLNVTRSFEGRSLRAYQDVVGVWTIGYGSTNYDKYAVSVIGKKIGKGVEITAQQAEDIFVHSVQNNYLPAVLKALSNPTQAQIDAGADFHYNTGAIAKASWPAALNRGDMNACRVSILSWNKAGGRVFAGLTRRRNRNWAMIEKGDYGPEGNQGPVVLDERGRPTGEVVKVPAASVAPTTADQSTGMAMIGPGSTGPEVEELQGWLKELALYDGPIDGNYGEKNGVLYKAVWNYQAGHPNLNKDGIVGPATRASLIRELDSRKKLKGVAKTAFVGFGGGGVSWGAVSASLAKVVLVSSAILAAGALIYILWKYRDVVKATFNRFTGKETA